MRVSRFLMVVFLTTVGAAVCASVSSFASGDEWRAIDPAELASKTPSVDKNADAEAIFWEVRIDDGEAGHGDGGKRHRAQEFRARSATLPDMRSCAPL